MTLPNEIDDILVKVADQWDKTEQILKLAESVSEGPIIPSVFELRYAGRRLVDLTRAGLSHDLDKTKTYALEVEQFCFRAQHDAIDGIIGALDDRLRFMEREFGVDLLFIHFKHYSTINVKLDKLAKTVAESRGNRGSRVDIYDSIQKNDLPELIDRINELSQSEKALIALAEKEKHKGDIATKTLRWGIAAVIVAIILAIPQIISLFPGLHPK